MNRLAILLLLGALGLPWPARAVPTTFAPVIGNALLCLDAIDPSYFKSYLTEALKRPYKTQGQAYWFKADTPLLGVKLSELFVSTEESPYAFIGAVVEDDLKTARDKIQRSAGVEFRPAADGRLRTAAGTYLISYGKGRSKIFCVKHRIDRF